ncbi:MAG: FmdB family zinc ribbon protein [Candidatus Pacearchaeota archaeon]
MPIYEYQCTNESCRRMYDQLEPSTAPKIQPCIDCGSRAERLMSAPSIGNANSDSSSKGYSSAKFESSECPGGMSGHLEGLVISMAIPVPHYIAEKIVKLEKQKRAAPNN